MNWGKSDFLVFAFNYKLYAGGLACVNYAGLIFGIIANEKHKA